MVVKKGELESELKSAEEAQIKEQITLLTGQIDEAIRRKWSLDFEEAIVIGLAQKPLVDVQEEIEKVYKEAGWDIEFCADRAGEIGPVLHWIQLS